MKQYVIDELRINDHAILKAYLDDNYEGSRIGDIYWLPLAEHILNQEQESHKDCRPFYFTLELGPSELACELLVRTQASIKCTCMCYADTKQRNWLIEKIDSIFNKLGIIV